ncbi:hypothetical protein S40288_02814 [Stachybotrys chartarum IBT 40288]|nr:hypothetical protein S40288_02814 [Stachybotrys chartarum IBT 40288]
MEQQQQQLPPPGASHEMTGAMPAPAAPQGTSAAEAAKPTGASLYPDPVNPANSDASMASVFPDKGPGSPITSMGSLPSGSIDQILPILLASTNGNLALSQPSISADEIALYDRQIRLWGMAAQARIQSANILLITIRGLANEVAKNLVLAGIGSLTILDDAVVAEADLGAQFLLTAQDVGQNRALAASRELQKLNPRVSIHVDPSGVKSKGPSYFAGFDIVIATDLDPDSYNLINTATRLNSKPFYAAGVHGMYGFIFSDLIEHDYVIERDLGNVATKPHQETRTRSIVDVKTQRDGPKTIESVTKRELYSTWFLASDAAGLPDEYLKSRRRLKAVTPALSCLRALWEFVQLQGGRTPSNRDDLKMFTQIATQKHKALGLPSETLKPEFLRSFLQNLSSEIAPVTAILGGQLAQDVINVLGRSQQPIQNMIIFDGVSMESLMYPLHPEGNLGVSLLSGVEPLIPNGGGMMMPGAAGFDLSNFDVSSFVGRQGPNSMAAGSLPTDGLPMNAFPSQVPLADTNVDVQASNYHVPQNGAASGTPQPNGQAAGMNQSQADAP